MLKCTRTFLAALLCVALFPETAAGDYSKSVSSGSQYEIGTIANFSGDDILPVSFTGNSAVEGNGMSPREIRVSSLPELATEETNAIGKQADGVGESEDFSDESSSSTDGEEADSEGSNNQPSDQTTSESDTQGPEDQQLEGGQPEEFAGQVAEGQAAGGLPVEQHAVEEQQDKQHAVEEQAGEQLAGVQQPADDSQNDEFSTISLTRSINLPQVATIRNAQSGKSLDIQGASKEAWANLQQYQYNHTPAQRFRLESAGNGFYRIVNVNSGKVIDVMGAKAQPGTNVQQYNSNGTAAQLWIFHPTADGAYIIVSALSEGLNGGNLTNPNSGGMNIAKALVLDVQGGSTDDRANVQLHRYNGTAAQKFHVEQIERPMKNGLYRVTPQADAHKALDVAGASRENGANVQLYRSNDTVAQQFRFTFDETQGYYTITNTGSDKLLSLQENASAAGTNVLQHEPSQLTGQLWDIHTVEPGVVEIISGRNGLVLSLAGASGNGGFGSGAGGTWPDHTNVVVDTAKNSPAQRWKLSVVPLVKDGTYEIRSILGTVLDAVGGNTADGTNIWAYRPNGTVAQKFRLTHIGDGYYKIACINSGLALTAQSSLGSNVELRGYTNKASQLWLPEPSGDGYYTWENKASGLVLDIEGANAASGTNVQVFRNNGTNAQRFALRETGQVSVLRYTLTLDDMFGFQRKGNPYITRVPDETLRTSLDPSANTGSYYFQFADLRIYTGLTGEQLDRYINTNGSNGVLANKGYAFVNAAKKYKLNEAYLTAHTIQESGWGKSLLARGAYYDGKGFNYRGTDGKTYWQDMPGYPAGTYYNLFGIGAIDSDPSRGGIRTAIRNGWSSVDLAIEGAAQWISRNYVYAKYYDQPTLYDMKWDVKRSEDTREYGWHQYATDVLWARAIGNLMAKCYASAGVPDPQLSYLVPQYR